MKNLKKVLALALTFAMAISMFASAAFTDQADVSADHADDVAMLVELGVLGGYPDGSFKPQNTITRAEFAKMAYTIKYGKDDSGKLFSGSASTFTDVEGNANVAWAKGYINYCATQGIVGGVGNNKFDPQGNITVAQVAKMLLVILGADAAKEGYGGSNWMGNVVADAMELGVFDGWVGDPTEPATRELVATLMRNTIFAPVYEYNINGVGSQKNINGEENKTLGEQTMNLKHVNGIVVANDTCYINIDEDGKQFEDVYINDHAAEDEVVILYENEYGENDTKTFELDVPNDYIGAEVDVYYTIKNGKTTILGDLIVSADTVIYNLTAADIEIMPNGESGSSREIVPYIAINAGEKEFQVRPRNGQSTTVPANQKFAGTNLLDYFFFGQADSVKKSYEGELKNDATVEHTFYKELGTDSVQPYRAVSLDGGKSISYIFRTTTKELVKVSNYSEANDMILVSGYNTISELEKYVVITGEIAKGDEVIAYSDSGKLFLEATEEISGLATVVDDNEVTIGGNNYKLDIDMFGEEGVTSIAQYYIDERCNTEATKYIVYNGFIIDIDFEGTAASADQYAAVLASSYDVELGAAKVRLAFTDETVGTYAVGKVNGQKLTRKSDISYVEFQDNKQVGNIYRYAIAADGTVNLFDDNGAVKNGQAAKGANDGFSQGNVIIDGKSHASDDNSVVFLLFGGLEGSGASDPANYNPIEAVVYKVANLQDASASKYGYYYDGGEKESNQCAYVESNDGAMKTLVVATMPMGKTEPTVMPETDNVAYLVEAKYGYDSDNSEYFANITMITADGLVETKTVNNIDTKIGDTGSYGSVPKATSGAVKGTFARGSIIEFALDDNGIITALALRAVPDGVEGNMQSALKATGFAYATIASVGDKNIGYYEYTTTPYSVEEADNMQTIKKNKYEFEVIAIDDGNFVEGGEIETVGRKDTVPGGAFNAIVQTRSGEVVRIFSLYGNI